MDPAIESEEHKNIDVAFRRKLIGERLSACMLQQSMFTVVGVAAGMAISLRTKNTKYFILTSLMGTSADFLYGGMVECREIIDQYRACENRVAKLKLGPLDEKSN